VFCHLAERHVGCGFSASLADGLDQYFEEQLQRIREIRISDLSTLQAENARLIALLESHSIERGDMTRGGC